MIVDKLNPMQWIYDSLFPTLFEYIQVYVVAVALFGL